MTCIVFETPGLIDIRSFTLMGVTAKPNSANPIGYFGTGLKYSMAALIRLGCNPVVWIGKDKYTFFKKADKFRDTDLDMIWMKREKFHLLKASNHQLPFSTNYGRNWKPWMIYRELESNTRDENGTTLKIEGPSTFIEPVEGMTRICVDLPEFVDVHAIKNEIFLPEAVREGSGVQMVERKTKNLYWRGLRVFETQKPCLNTYNFLDRLELTEDRTLSNEFYARYALGKWIVKSEDEYAIKSIILASDADWESTIHYDNTIEPSETFSRVMEANHKRARVSAVGYYAGYDRRPMKEEFNLYTAHPLPWAVSGTVVYDANGKRIFDAPYEYVGNWKNVAEAIIKLLNPAQEEKTPLAPPATDKKYVGFLTPKSTDDIPF